ncbi:MAG: immunity protein 32 [Acidobacteria bacterium]|nr:immunity protein 32 [Acidobacteriota bacterium]
MSEEERLLAFVSDEKNEQLYLHLDLAGVNILLNELGQIKKGLEKNECPHGHLFSVDWGGWELSLSDMTDTDNGGAPVHHVKIYGWNEEWAEKHGFDRFIK